ncbi:short transient receptor potential channel 2-like [Actinia tenebrosa]|uniref:Short transient receptor potential channel 2-like n=1 Tax=Actinia tenebrosa TaxID=6105 RepID=A0A6P8H895_ACTTE|nr:short transient receptor potential channel 2-like [Actinia tenebrosa]
MAEEIVQLSDTEGAESIPGNDHAVNAEGRLHDHEESENTQFDDVASEEQQKKKEKEVDKMIESDDIDKMKLVRPNMLKGLSTNSLEKALDYSSKLTEKAQRSKVQEEELQAIASSMEEYAFHLIEPLKKDHNKKQIFKLKFDHIAAKAVLLKQKKFLAHPVMYELLRDCWKGIFRSERSKFGWMLLYSWTLFDVLLFPIIYFILHLIQVFGRVWPKRANGTYRKSDFYETLYHERFKTPYFIFVRDMLSYFALLVLHFFLCFQPSTLHFIVEEWIILIFFLGRFMMEVYQVVNGFKNVRQTFSNYLSDSWNRLDAVTLTIYAVLLILRVITWSVHTSISNNPLLVGAGYLYDINSMLLTLRVFGHIIELKAKFGTIQIALFQITENIVAVFGQLLAVIIAFSLAISKIRMTQISFEGTPSTVFLESWWSIAKHLLWSFLLEPQVLIVPYERTIVFVQILYVLFLIIAVVMLMNMMIAILTNTYQRAERNAFQEWSYKKAATILTYCNYHPVPVPLNIISLTFLLMRNFYKKIRCRSSTVDIEKDPKKVALDNDIKGTDWTML